MILFDGKALAHAREVKVGQQIAKLGVSPRVQTFLFSEDSGSVLYTRLKEQACIRVGITYEPCVRTFDYPNELLISDIRQASTDPHISGVMVQKPAKQTWLSSHPGKTTQDFSLWWESVTSALDPRKDIDCLTPQNLERIFLGTWKKAAGGLEILPATVQAVRMILGEAFKSLHIAEEVWKNYQVLVVGRSDIVGKPLAVVLQEEFSHVVNVGRADFSNVHLTDFEIVISAVGTPGIITQVKEGAIVIDVGAPKGDVDFERVQSQATFLTPVPGGVGPMTVACLLENIMTIASFKF